MIAQCHKNFFPQTSTIENGIESQLKIKKREKILCAKKRNGGKMGTKDDDD